MGADYRPEARSTPIGTRLRMFAQFHGPGIRRPVASIVAALVCGACVAGCASWKPFQDPQKAARDREKYGPTADQRIKELATAAKAAAATPEQGVEFTQRLARDMLAEHDPRVRRAILETAAKFDTAEAVAICKGALEDPDERVRLAACRTWAKRGGEDAVALLGGRFRADASLDVRLEAIRDLGTLGDKAAIPVLAQALEDADPVVQYRAVAALKKVSGRDLGNDVNVWREWAADPAGSRQEWSIAEAFRKLF